MGSFFQISWGEFRRILERALGHFGNKSLIQWREDDKKLHLYYTYEGDKYYTIIVKDLVPPEQLKAFVERFLNPTYAVQIIKYI